MDPVLYFQELLASGNVVAALFAFGLGVFSLWMLVDCLQNQRECFWIWIILATGGLGSFVYFYHFHWDGDLMHSFVWTGMTERRRLKELKSRVHYFDKAADHEELGDAYAQLKKLDEAEKCYRTALDRDPKAFDSRVQLGNVLLAQNRPDEAWEYLRPAYEEKPDYAEDHLLWQCARCQTKRGELDDAVRLYDYLLSRHSYYEAQVEFAEVLLQTEGPERGIELLYEIVEDFQHSPRYVQRREAKWVRKARRLLRTSPVRREPVAV